VIRSLSYFFWSRTFLLGVGLTDLGHFDRYFGQNKEIVSVFNGSEVYFNVGIGLTFLGRCCSTRQELYFQLLFEMILAVETVEILCPEVNVRSFHNTKTISIQIYSIDSKGDYSMSWGAQNRSKDAKTPSTPRGRSEKPELDCRPVQPIRSCVLGNTYGLIGAYWSTYPQLISTPLEESVHGLRSGGIGSST
jgi:hypothetical protein